MSIEWKWELCRHGKHGSLPGAAAYSVALRGIALEDRDYGRERPVMHVDYYGYGDTEPEALQWLFSVVQENLSTVVTLSEMVLSSYDLATVVKVKALLKPMPQVHVVFSDVFMKKIEL